MNPAAQNIAITALRKLAFPLKVLYLGHIFLVAYVLSISGAAALIAYQADYYLKFIFKLLARETSLNTRVLAIILTGGEIVILSLLIPVLVTALALPARTVWKYKRINWSELLSSTLRDIGYCLRACVVLIRPALFTLVPALAMLFLYIAFVTKTELLSLYYIYTMGCILVAALSILKSLPVLMTPFISVCGDMAPEKALYLSRAVLKDKSKEIFIVGIFTLICLYFGDCLILRSNLPYSLFLRLVYALSISWYVITSLSVITMNALARYAAAYQAHADFNTAHAAHVHRPYELKPNSAQIQRIWVRD